MTTIKALTLWQPWASLIWDGRKKIETRNWPISYRGPLAIHAGKRIDGVACQEFGYDWRIIPTGAVLRVVSVQGCVRFPHSYAPPDPYGDFSPGRYGFLLTMLEKFPKPIPAIGHQWLWDWPYQPSNLPN